MPKRKSVAKPKQEKKYYKAILHEIDSLQATLLMKLDPNPIDSQFISEKCSKCTQSTSEVSMK